MATLSASAGGIFHCRRVTISVSVVLLWIVLRVRNMVAGRRNSQVRSDFAILALDTLDLISSGGGHLCLARRRGCRLRLAVLLAKVLAFHRGTNR